MFDFIRKAELWDALERGWSDKLHGARPYELKTAQDLAVYRLLADRRGQDIAEIGGGASRLLPALSGSNRCVNVEKFEGADGGPDREMKLDGVRTVRAFLGEFDSRLAPDSFDAVFSVSVVEHVPTPRLQAFLEDGLRILRRGGLWLHAIDMYLGDEDDQGASKRHEIYKSWASLPGALEPAGPISDAPPRFSCDMATNPDNIMYAWGKIAPALTEKRQRMQNVSVLTASRKI